MNLIKVFPLQMILILITLFVNNCDVYAWRWPRRPTKRQPPPPPEDDYMWTTYIIDYK